MIDNCVQDRTKTRNVTEYRPRYLASGHFSVPAMDPNVKPVLPIVLSVSHYSAAG